jgi:hypothetical protein
VNLLLTPGLVQRGRSPGALPEPTRDKRTCEYCKHAPACAAYHRVLEGGEASTAGGAGAEFERQRGMTPAQQTFLAQWERLISLEVGVNSSKLV